MCGRPPLANPNTNYSNKFNKHSAYKSNLEFVNTIIFECIEACINLIALPAVHTVLE